MYRKQIFRIISLVYFVIVGPIICGAAGEKVSPAELKSSKVNVIKVFEKRVVDLEAELKQEKETSKRFDLFLRAYSELAELRAKNPRQKEEDEINMSLFMDTLNYLPERKLFDSKKCNDYKKKVRSMSQSYQAENEVFIEKALRIVDLICA